MFDETNEIRFAMKSPLLIMLADTHLKANNGLLVISIFEQLIEKMKELEITYAVHLGDFFQDRSSQDIDRLTIIQQIIALFRDNELMLYGISGNHDLKNLTSSLSYMSLYEHPKEDNFELFSAHDFVDFKNIRIHFIPYSLESETYPQELQEAVKFIDPKKKNVLMTHIAVKGVRNNDGTIVDEGGIAVEAFKKFDKVYVGHYHDSSKIEPNIYYIGSAYQSNFGESEGDKGFTVLYDDLTTKHISSVFKKYKQLKIQANDKKALDEIRKELKTIDPEQYNIRVKILGSSNDIESLDVSMLKDLGVSVKFENTVETIVDFEELEDAEMITFNDKEILKNYVFYTKEFGFTAKQRSEGLAYLKML